MSVSSNGPLRAGMGRLFTERIEARRQKTRRLRPVKGAKRDPRRIFSKLTPYLFVSIALGLLILLTYVPAINMVYYSFTSWRGTGAGPKPEDFLGNDGFAAMFGNYVKVFTDPSIFKVFFVSAYYFVGAFIQMGLALYFATILSFSTRFRNLFRGILFFPYLLNGVAIGFVFLYFFQPGGTLDSLLSLVGVEDPPQWLGDASIANYSLAATSVWRYMGLNFVLFLGAIQSIPGELYEAAELDGANRWRQFRYIIMPGIRRIIGLSFILAIAGSLSVFEIPFIMTTGANGTTTFVIATVQTAFHYHRVGLASAMAVVLLIIVLLVTWAQRKLFPDEKVDLV